MNKWNELCELVGVEPKYRYSLSNKRGVSIKSCCKNGLIQFKKAVPDLKVNNVEKYSATADKVLGLIKLLTKRGLPYCNWFKFGFKPTPTKIYAQGVWEINHDISRATGEGETIEEALASLLIQLIEKEVIRKEEVRKVIEQ
jgi:hypothetical protein